jgi:hypothetical protein
MKVEAREQALLQLVDDYRERACRRILGDAEHRGRELLAQVYQKERAALHERVSTERARAQGLIDAARAERSTRHRRLREQRDQAALAALWPALRRVLAEHWAHPEHRPAWVQQTFDRAIRRLPKGAWEVRHAEGWPDAERLEQLKRVFAETGAMPSTRADASLSAGLVIMSGGAVLDASLEGLMSDRARLEARALALWKARGLDQEVTP